MVPGAFYSQPAYNEAVSAVTATNSVQLGSVRVENGEEYIYVYNAGAQQVSVGQIGVMSNVSGFSVTASSTTGADLAVGFVKHATLTTATYGWLLVKGFTSVSNGMTSTGLVSGDLIFPAANGNVQVAIGTAISSPLLGKMMFSVASAAVGGMAYVKAFGV